MRSFVLTVCALAASAASSSSVFAITATGQFTTVGSKVYAPDGSEFVSRGVNVPGYNFWAGHDATNDVSKIVDTWNFNLVRVNNQPLVDYKSWGASIDIDKIVNAYTSRGVVVELEMHESTGTYFTGQQLTDATTWWKAEAAKYKNNPYVWFNLGNEPGNTWVPDGQAYLNMNQTLIKAIRDDVGATNMIVADGTNFGQDQAWDDLGTLNPAHSAILTYGKQLQSFGGKNYSNILFDTHIYGEWSSPGAMGRLEKYIQAAQAQGLPLMFGEYGATIWGDYTQEVKDFLAIANKYNIGRAAWHWSDAGGWDLTTATDPTAIGTSWETGGGYLISSESNPTNLTPFGQMVWADTHSVPFIPEPTTCTLVLAGTALSVSRRHRRA